jgi:hypothetical protein
MSISDRIQEMLDQFGGGAGVLASEPPNLKLLQVGSPEAMSGNTLHVADAQAGDFVLRGGKNSLIKGETGFSLQTLAFEIP